MPSFQELFTEIYVREAGRCTATVVRLTGDIDAAEDAVADAFATAAVKWSEQGVPANPGGWITTTARNRAIDHRRRESTRDDRQLASTRLFTDDVGGPDLGGPDLGGPDLGDRDLGDTDVVPDDQLRLVFLCCHPDLSPDAQVALTLRLLGGLETPEIARAFLVPEATMAQRLVRAKRKIRDAGLDYRIPAKHELVERLVPVMATLYLIFNEGHTAALGDRLQRHDLTAEAIRLARVMSQLMPDEPEVVGLLALFLLTDARQGARLDRTGDIVRLADQDRGKWDQQLISEGHALVRACLERDEPGPYQLQAAIAAVHADAPTAADTDWAQIVLLYDHLLSMLDSPVVEMNRAIAIGELDGPAAGLAALEGLDLDASHLLHASRAEFLARLGRSEDSSAALVRALALVDNDVERLHLHRRLARHEGNGG